MIWGDRKGERPITHPQVMEQYLVLPLGRSWILLLGIKPVEPVVHQKNKISPRPMTVGRIILDLKK